MQVDKRLAGKRILVTRAHRDAGPIRALLEAEGASVLELPAVAIEPPEDWTSLDNALRRLSDYGWIVFTSRNAVHAVFDRLAALNTSFGAARVAAVGPSTAAALQERGVAVACIPAEATGEALAAALRHAGVAGARILLPAGNLARPTVRQMLEEAGALVDEVIVYRTVPPSQFEPSALDLLRRRKIDVVALFSPSAIRNLAEMLGSNQSSLQAARLACIGPTTATAVRELGLEPAAVAEPHTVDGLVQAIIDYTRWSTSVNQSDITGVLLMAYGTPDTLDNVEAYYTHIRGGRTPAPELVDELRERYRRVGGTTPLLAITEVTGARLEDRLNQIEPDRYRVFLGMKHWHPFIERAVGEMAGAGIQRAVGLALAPHYSKMSIGGYYHYIDAAQEKLGSNIDFARIQSWHLHPPYLEAVATRIRRRLTASPGGYPAGEDVTVIFTAHSLPERILEHGDPYPGQLRETSEALAGMLGLKRWTFSYQSAGRTAEAWLGPDLVDTVYALADEGVKNILVAPIGFVSDHLEILYDIDDEAQGAAKERGITLSRTEMLNASPDFVGGLAQLVRSTVAQMESSRSSRACP